MAWLRRNRAKSHTAKPAARAAQLFSLAGLAASVVRRTALRRFPEVSLAQRLAMLPATARLDAPITIRFNDQHVPFVEAQSDRDAAVGLGVVHGHLRLAQMEVMRRAATGRLAEVAGPAALELDRLTRLIDFPRAREASLALAPPETRAWMEGFADGISAAGATERPPEFEILGVEPQPWTVDDLFAVSRLCSADYAWRVWRTLYPLRQEDDWQTMWASLIGVAAVADEDMPITPETLGEAIPTAFARTGSNACAISGARTKSGKPLLACDPHLTITTPTVWLLAGFRTPEVAVWGMMIPALPIFAPGRNADGAWGGTNLHATSSELVNVAGEAIEERTVSVPVRGKPDQEVRLRESPIGPVISDSEAFHMPGETVALHWIGHRASDEFSAFHKLMRARSHADFEDAVDAYALPGLTMLWAGTDGTIAKMIGAHLPRRPLSVPGDIVTSIEEAHASWSDILTGRDLPHAVDPPEGYLVSANEAPQDAPITISLFFAADLRARRLGELLAARDDHGLDYLRATQLDVYHAAAHALAGRLAERARSLGLAGAAVDALAAWDGHYEADSAGALAFELVAATVVERLEATSPKKAVSPHWRPFDRLSRLVAAAAEDELDAALGEAADVAGKPFETNRTWGTLHKVRLQHPLGRLPWLAGRLARLEFPSPGSNDTLLKAMHPVGTEAHTVPFGANARFVADLSDPDETYGVVLGGQDGWPGSRTLFDQVGAFRRGDMIRLPLTLQRIADEFVHRVTLAPQGEAAA